MNALERWAFAPSDQYQLGIFRVLFVGWLAHEYVTRVLPRLAEHAARPAELLAPVSVVRWLGLPAPVPTSWLVATSVIACALLVSAGVGWFTRVSLCALAALNLWLGAASASWGYTSHASALPALVLVVLACAPGVHACSVDSWRAARKQTKADFLFGRPQSVWPVRLTLVLLCTFYFASGYAKLRYAGWQWADGRTLAFYLEGGSLLGPSEPQRFFASAEANASARFRDGWGLEDYAYVGRPTPLGRALGASPIATRALSVFTLLVELGFPLALLGRRLLVAWLLFGLALHLGIEATLRIDFTSYLVVYLLFVDWKAGLQRFAPSVVRRLHGS